MLTRFNPRTLGLFSALFVLIVDQGHKAWMLSIFNIAARAPITVTPFLDLTMSWNYGVSYSLFATHAVTARLALICVQGGIVLGLLYWLWRASAHLCALGLGLIIGGALGNMTDRLFRGAVADFFYFHTSLPVGPLANYVFNIADVGITLGAALLLIESLASNDSRPSTSA